MTLYLQADQEFDLPVKAKTDICTIMYTSGTTGDPKGVLISNASIICLVAGVDRLLNCVNEQVRYASSPFIMHPYIITDQSLIALTMRESQLEQTDVYMSYLPLAHIFDRVVEELFMFHGASIGFWRGVSTVTCLLIPLGF